jgi:hypothetical protein
LAYISYFAGILVAPVWSYSSLGLRIVNVTDQ